MIKSIKAQEIKDSRGNPTLEVFVNSASACVPAGASVGILEAPVAKVPKAIENIEKIIAPTIIGRNPLNQIEIDNVLMSMLEYGGNATTGISMAVARLGAEVKNISLNQHIAQLYGMSRSIPRPCFNVINGGAHAKNHLAIQEFMAVPDKGTFKENLEAGKKIFEKLGVILEQRFGKIPIGDEGGYSPNIASIKAAIEYILKADDKVELILDCAASQFYKPDRYFVDDKELSQDQLLEFYIELVDDYPIIALEDPYAENDWIGFQMIFRDLGDQITIIGDDLLVTNVSRIEEAAEKTACNGAIIKVNQIGTVSGAAEAVRLAKRYSWKTMVSHRSGETEDSFIADFAVGVGADFIKSGAPGPVERMAKYNRLLSIVHELES